MKKGLFIVAIVVVVAAMAASYFYFKQQQNTAVSAIDAVPVNSAAIIEVKDARAVLKNPSILVFDEATASVDSETESQIQEAIERLIYGRTTLMIAHRLSTLRKANKIVVVDKGRIIECGSHDELMALKGKFYRLIQIQSMSEQVSKQKSEENFE